MAGGGHEQWRAVPVLFLWEWHRGDRSRSGHAIVCATELSRAGGIGSTNVLSCRVSRGRASQERDAICAGYDAR